MLGTHGRAGLVNVRGGAAQHSQFNSTPILVSLHRPGKWTQRTRSVSQVHSTLTAQVVKMFK